MGIKIIDKSTGEEIVAGAPQLPAVPAAVHSGGLSIKDSATGETLRTTVGQRVASTVSGAVKQSVASWGDSAATKYAAGQKHRDNQNDWHRSEYQRQYDDAERDYRFMLEDNEADPGTWSQGDLDSALNRMSAAKTKLDAMNYVVDSKVQQRATEAARDTMYQVAQSGAADIEKAKDGLGAGGRFLVDAGAAGVQLATDAAANYLLFGGSKTPGGRWRPNSTLGAKMSMGERVFGSSTMQARQEGATLGQQIGYGSLMAALEMGIEKLGGLDSVYGKGATSGLARKITSKLARSPAAQTVMQVLSTAGSEGLEEFLSGMLSPALQSIYDGKSMGSHYSTDTLADAAYEALVGSVLGGAGGAIDLIGNRTAAARNNGPNETAQETTPSAAGERSATQMGTDIPQGENAAEGTQRAAEAIERDPLATALFGPEASEQVNIDNAARMLHNNSVGGDENGKQGTQLDGTSGEGVWAGQARGPFAERGVDGQRDLPAPGIVRLSEQSKATLEKRGVDAVDIAPTEDSAAFSSLLGEARSEDAANGWAVTPKSSDDLAGHKMFLAKDGGVGLAIAEDGDIQAVFRSKKRHPGKQAMRSVLPQAIAAGGRKLDCYGAGLVNVYERAGGMVPVCRVEFNPKYANDGWTPEKGTPYIYFMMATETDAEKIIAGQDTHHLSTQEELDSLPTFGKEEYDAAYAYRDGLLARMGSESSHTNTVGAAEAGFQTPDSPSVERESAQRKNWPMTRGREEAGAFTRPEWNEVFKYMTRPEAVSLQEATNLLYMQRGAEPYYISMETEDGPVTIEKGPETVFLGDVDPEGLQELMDYLRDAPAWSDVMTDTAMLLETELMGRSRPDGAALYGEGAFEVDDTMYREWVQTIREKRTDTARGLQAGAKWFRKDGGAQSRMDALDALAESDLSEEEQAELFDDICDFDTRIENAGSDEELVEIIMEIAQRRGTVNGLTGKQSKRLTNRARNALGSLSTAELKAFAHGSASALATDPTPVDIGQKLKTIQILNMLSSPRTAATNLTGNTSFYGVDALAMRGAALLDMALSKATGTRSMPFEGFALGKGARDNAMKAMRRSLAEITLDVDMGGTNRYGQTSRRTFKSSGGFVERVLSACERNMGYALTTTDEGYKGAARATQRQTQQLMDEGKIKTENKDYAKAQADELAKYRTFQRDGRLSVAIQAIHDVLNLVGVGDSGKTLNGKTVHSFGAGDLVAPFIRVAGNLVSTSVDYNPVQAVKGTVEIVDVIRRAKSGEDVAARQAKALSDTTRGLTGTAIAVGAMLLSQAGLLKRAEDEDDEDVAALNQSEGMTGTQLNVDAALRWVSGKGADWQKGDTLVDLSRLEPLNFLFSFGAELADNEEDDILSTVGEIASDSVTSLVSAAGDLPVMGTMAGIAKDVLVYGDTVPNAVVENLGKTAISSATPNILAGFAKGIDDKQRSTYSGDGVGDVLLDTLLSRIPGARQTLPTSVSSLGEEKENPGSLGWRLFNAMVNPLGVNKYTQGEVSQEMERVREKTGETGFYPSKSIPSELSYTDDSGKEHTATLDYAQRQQYQAARSGAQLSVTAAMMASPNYKRADTKTQAALLDRVHNYANQYARAQVLGRDSVQKWVLNSQTSQRDMGISQADFFYYYEKYGSGIMGGQAYDKTVRMVKAGLTVDQWATMKGRVDANNNDSVDKSEVTRYIEANFPRAKWRQLFDAYKGNSNWKNPY